MCIDIMYTCVGIFLYLLLLFVYIILLTDLFERRTFSSSFTVVFIMGILSLRM